MVIWTPNVTLTFDLSTYRMTIRSRRMLLCTTSAYRCDFNYGHSRECCALSLQISLLMILGMITPSPSIVFPYNEQDQHSFWLLMNSLIHLLWVSWYNLLEAPFLRNDPTLKVSPSTNASSAMAKRDLLQCLCNCGFSEQHNLLNFQNKRRIYILRRCTAQNWFFRIVHWPMFAHIICMSTVKQYE